MRRRFYDDGKSALLAGIEGCFAGWGYPKDGCVPRLLHVQQPSIDEFVQPITRVAGSVPHLVSDLVRGCYGATRITHRFQDVVTRFLPGATGHQPPIPAARIYQPAKINSRGGDKGAIITAIISSDGTKVSREIRVGNSAALSSGKPGLLRQETGEPAYKAPTRRWGTTMKPSKSEETWNSLYYSVCKATAGGAVPPRWAA